MKIHDVTQNSPQWDLIRGSIPTASNGSKLVTSKGEPSKSMRAYAEQLGQNKYAGKPVDQWGGNSSTEYGHDMEDESIAWYEMNKGVETSIVGFCTDDHERYGASPDRFAGENGLLEAKNFPKSHFDVLKHWHKHKTCPAARVVQCQFQMMVCEKEWCDITFYHPILPSLIIRLHPDEKIFRALRMQIAECENIRDQTVELLRGIEND